MNDDLEAGEQPDGPPPADERAPLVLELKSLRRGAGLQAPDAGRRIGPILTRICEVDLAGSPHTARLTVIGRIEQTLPKLPTDLQQAVQAAFALAPADQSRFLAERMQWLGRKLNRDSRTAVRRVETGLSLLSDVLLAEDGPVPSQDLYAPDGWFVESFAATLMMHKDPVELMETRRVVSTREGLDEIVVAWSIPSESEESRSGLRVDMMYGGDLRRDEVASTPTYWSCTIRPDQPLAFGQVHEFQVRVTSLPRDLFRPYYVLTPFRRCDEFVLRAKFDHEAPPAQVWQVDGVPFQLLDESQPIGDPLALNSVDEVTGRYEHLRMGLSYGLRWRFD
jgi:hypothetical protein